MKHKIPRKNEILRLRAEGKSYRQITNILQCSSSVVCYHCGDGQKKKYQLRTIQSRKKQHPYINKLIRFFRTINKKNKPSAKRIKRFISLISTKISQFHTDPITKRVNMKTTFTYKDILEKFGENPKCYLTGEQIDIYDTKSYHFDHIIPKSKGGPNTLDNLGICTKQANYCKRDMTPEEFINFCKKIVEYNSKTTNSDN